MNSTQGALPRLTRCFPRRLISAVSILLVFLSFSQAGLLEAGFLQEKIRKKIREDFGEKVRIESIRLYLRKPLHYGEIRELRVEIRAREGRPEGSAKVFVRTDRWTRVFGATLRLRWRCPLLVFSRGVKAGERIFPWYLERREVFKGRCERPVEFGNEEVVNYRAVRDILEGEALTLKVVEKAPLILRGDRVSVIYRRGNLEISFPGLALERGFYGERIRVKSLNTGKVLRGKVIAEGRVIVR